MNMIYQDFLKSHKLTCALGAKVKLELQREFQLLLPEYNVKVEGLFDGGLTEFSISVFNVPEEDHDRVWDVIHESGIGYNSIKDEDEFFFLPHIVNPEQTQKHYPEHIK